MSTLALDLGTKTGWALQTADPHPARFIEHGTHDFAPVASEADGWRFLRFRSWLTDTKAHCCAVKQPLQLVLYERVDFIVPGQVYAAHVWGGMWATLTAWCEHHQIDYQGIAVGTIKKAIAGKGNASKADVRAAVRSRGFKVSSSDEADALALLFTQTMEKAA